MSDIRNRMLAVKTADNRPDYAPETLYVARDRYATELTPLALESYCESEDIPGMIEPWAPVSVNLEGNPEVALPVGVDWERTTWLRGDAAYVYMPLVDAGIIELVGSTRYGIGNQTAYVAVVDVDRIPALDAE